MNKLKMHPAFARGELRRGKKVLVTGGLGFIGSNLVDSLIAHGHKVVVVDRNKPSFFKPLNPKAKHYRMDFSAPDIEKVFKKEKPDAVIHLAAQISVTRSIKDPLSDALNNIIGPIRLLEVARKNKVKRFLFSSSGGAIYGDYPKFPTPELCSVKPLSPYGIGKQAFEYYLFQAAKLYGFSTLAIRMSNVYGPRQGLGGESGAIGIFCKQISLGEPILIFGNGRQTRDFLFVGDAVEAFHKGLDSNLEGFVNVSSGREVTIKKTLDLVAKAAGLKVNPEYFSARPGEILRSVLDNRQALKKLGWKPKTSLEEGIKITYAWFNEHKDLYRKLGSSHH